MCIINFKPNPNNACMSYAPYLLYYSKSCQASLCYSKSCKASLEERINYFVDLRNQIICPQSQFMSYSHNTRLLFQGKKNTNVILTPCIDYFLRKGNFKDIHCNFAYIVNIPLHTSDNRLLVMTFQVIELQIPMVQLQHLLTPYG